MGLQPGKSYEISIESNNMDRTLPAVRTITIPVASEKAPNSDVTQIKFIAIEKSDALEITGSAFFEGETT